MKLATTLATRHFPPFSRTGKKVLYNLNNGRVAQLGERLVRNEEVAGSIPVTSTILIRCSRSL